MAVKLSVSSKERLSQKERKARTRALLIDATVQEINLNGVVGLRTSNITKRAGVTWGAAQHLFGDKTELLLAVLEHVSNRIIEKKRHAPFASLPLRRRINRLIESSWTLHRRAEIQVIYEIMLAKRNDPDFRARQIPILLRQESQVHAIYIDLFSDIDVSHERIRAVHDLIALSLSALARWECLFHDEGMVNRHISLLKAAVWNALAGPEAAAESMVRARRKRRGSRDTE